MESDLEVSVFVHVKITCFTQ